MKWLSAHEIAGGATIWNRALAILYNRFPLLAWLWICRIIFQRARTMPGSFRQDIHLLPLIDAVCLVSGSGPIQPIRVFSVIRAREDCKTEIAETPDKILRFYVSEQSAQQEADRLGVGWHSQEFWLDSPNPYPHSSEPVQPISAQCYVELGRQMDGGLPQTRMRCN